MTVMKKVLVVVDMQNDFVNGALGSTEAQTIVPAVCEKIRSFDGKIYVTLDTHGENYMQSSEGKKLPVPHCIKGTAGHELNARVQDALDGKDYKTAEKLTFGCVRLPEMLKEDGFDAECGSIELIGLCTDICVVSNALLLKANFPEAEISVDSACCAGVTEQLHRAALDTMKSCQINII